MWVVLGLSVRSELLECDDFVNANVNISVYFDDSIVNIVIAILSTCYLTVVVNLFNRSIIIIYHYHSYPYSWHHYFNFNYLPSSPYYFPSISISISLYHPTQQQTPSHPYPQYLLFSHSIKIYKLITKNHLLFKAISTRWIQTSTPLLF